jgi:hypothetical protein
MRHHLYADRSLDKLHLQVYIPMRAPLVLRVHLGPLIFMDHQPLDVLALTPNLRPLSDSPVRVLITVRQLCSLDRTGRRLER